MLVHEPQEDPVALPLLQGGELPLADPGQLTLVAVLRRAGEARGVEQVHILGRVDVGDEGHKPAVAVLRESQPRFLQNLAADAVLRAFLILKFSADADPLPKNAVKVQQEEPIQLTMLTKDTEVLNRLKSLDVNTLTPIESMNILFELANMLK